MDDAKFVANVLGDAAVDDFFAQSITNILHAHEVDKYVGYAYMVSMRLVVMENEFRNIAFVTVFTAGETPSVEPRVKLEHCKKTSIQKL